ncbi:MAG: DUF4339 domain-containing protein [Planctomycetes bacterium]|nr:DUF4339 domain-containing protein [Planctomycetota bacterium]
MEWYVVSAGTRLGPMSQEDLRRRMISGTSKSSDLVWKSGMKDWIVAGQVPELLQPRAAGAPHSQVKHADSAGGQPLMTSTKRVIASGAIGISVLELLRSLWGMAELGQFSSCGIWIPLLLSSVGVAIFRGKVKKMSVAASILTIYTFLTLIACVMAVQSISAAELSPPDRRMVTVALTLNGITFVAMVVLSVLAWMETVRDGHTRRRK